MEGGLLFHGPPCIKCNYLLIIFYTIKVVLDCKIIYILLIIENTVGGATLENHLTDTASHPAYYVHNEGKVRFHPVTGHTGPEGESRYSDTLS